MALDCQVGLSAGRISSARVFPADPVVLGQRRRSYQRCPHSANSSTRGSCSSASRTALSALPKDSGVSPARWRISLRSASASLYFSWLYRASARIRYGSPSRSTTVYSALGVTAKRALYLYGYLCVVPVVVVI